jgi:hypothetical protein
MTNLFQEVVKEVSKETGIEPAQIFSPKRTHELLQARRLVAKVLDQYGWSSSRIGREMGNDHTTVTNRLRSSKDTQWAEDIADSLREHHLSREDARQSKGLHTLSHLTNLDLLQELIRRTENGQRVQPTGKQFS